MIMSSAAYKNGGAIVIWYDETEGGDTKQFTLPEIVISRLAKGDAYDSTLTYTHSSDLKTMEELFGVYNPDGSFLGDAGTLGTNDLSDLFVAGSVVPEPSSLVLYAIAHALLLLAGTGGGKAGRTISAQLILDVHIGEVEVDHPSTDHVSRNRLASAEGYDLLLQVGSHPVEPVMGGGSSGGRRRYRSRT